MEMLFLLGMVLRGGPYEGMYLAKFLHGAMGVLAVLAIITTHKRNDSRGGLFSGVLLATAPFMLYLSWLAMVELAMIFYLTLAVLWLREWLNDGNWRVCLCLGTMLGCACAVKYLSVGFILAPVLGAMIVACVVRRGSFKWVWSVPLVAVLAPAMVPISLLAGGLLWRLTHIKGADWGRAVGVAMLGMAICFNLLTGYRMYRANTSGTLNAHGVPGDLIARTILKEAYDLPDGSRIMLLGDAKGFYFPPGTIYATAFDAQPLDWIARGLDRGELTPREGLERILQMGVTHIWVDWLEIVRLGNTYGFPASLSREVILRHRQNRRPGLKVFDQLHLGVFKEIEYPQPTSGADIEIAPARRVWVTIYSVPPASGQSAMAAPPS